MNPSDSQQPSVEPQSMQKLEDDLKVLEKSSTIQEDTISNTAEKLPNVVQQPNSYKKSSPLVLISVVLFVVALVGIIVYVFGMQLLGKWNILSLSPKACTMEAKICPDGSSVGRTGPNCEFATCPAVKTTPDPTANWKTFSQDRFSVKLPTSWKSSQSSNSGEISWDFSSGAPGRVELIVAKLNTNLDQVKNDISSGLSQGQVVTKTISLGDATGIEYFGCFGVEGCMNQYIVVTSFGGSTYKIDFTPYSDQEVNLYQNIISNFRFAEVTPSSSPASTPVGY